MLSFDGDTTTKTTYKRRQQHEYNKRQREDKDKDVFVHVSAVRDAQLDHLNEGESISFDVEDGPKGPNATNLQKI